MTFQDYQKPKLRKLTIMDKKYYKIVYGYNEGDYLPITSDELHKAFVIAIEGGSATFEAGFYNNRGSDILRIVPDWHRVRGWNRGHKMNELDYEDVQPLESKYQTTLANGKLLAEYIVRENKRELLSKPAPVAFQSIKKLQTPEAQKVIEARNQLANNFKIPE